MHADILELQEAVAGLEVKVKEETPMDPMSEETNIFSNYGPRINTN